MEFLHRRQHFFRLHRQEITGVFQDPVPFVHLSKSPVPAEEFHPAASLVPDKPDDLDGPHHARIGGMGATAGADVPVMDIHQAHGAPKFFILFPQREFPQFRGVYIMEGDGLVGPNASIGHPFRLLGRFFIDFPVQIDEHTVFIHMEAHIVGPAGFPEGIGKDMFPAVLLHPVQTDRPIQFHSHGLPRFHRGPGPMADFRSIFRSMVDRHIIQPAPVRKLAAPLWEDHGLVQDHFIMIFFLFTAPYRSLAFPEEGIVFIKFFCHGTSPQRFLPSGKRPGLSPSAPTGGHCSGAGPAPGRPSCPDR